MLNLICVQMRLEPAEGFSFFFKKYSFENQIGIHFLSITLLGVSMGLYYWWYVAIPIAARYPKSTPTGAGNIMSHNIYTASK